MSELNPSSPEAKAGEATLKPFNVPEIQEIGTLKSLTQQFGTGLDTVPEPTNVL